MAKNAKKAKGASSPEVAEETKTVNETEAVEPVEEPAKGKKKAEGGKKDAKSEKKPNFFVRTGRKAMGWLHDMRVELKKVHWPTRTELLKNCLVVLVCILAVGICIWVFDALAAAIIRALVNLFQG